MRAAAPCKACGAGVGTGASRPIMSPWTAAERICEDCAFQVFLDLMRAMVRRSSRSVDQDLQIANLGRFLAAQLTVAGAFVRRRQYSGPVPQEVSSWVH